VAATTLFGRFPLIRQFGPTMDQEDEDHEVHSYIIPGQARRRAVRGALTKLAKAASTEPLHVVGEQALLENEEDGRTAPTVTQKNGAADEP
jgi:hypothetical protein